MANEQNLKPLNTRSKEERKRIGAMGGKASGKARRMRKRVSANMEILLALYPTKLDDIKQLLDMGISLEDIDNSMLITLSLFNKAKDGDVNAFKEIFRLVGEDDKCSNGSPVIIVTEENDLLD